MSVILSPNDFCVVFYELHFHVHDFQHLSFVSLFVPVDDIMSTER